MKTNQSQTELWTRMMELSPYFKEAFFYTVVGTFFALAPTVLMMQVYDRVLNSRSTTTLWMLMLIAFFVYMFMELIELHRAGIMQRAGAALDEKLRSRTFDAIFAATLRKLPGAGAQAMGELRAIRTFLSSPAMLAILDAPASVVFLVFIFVIDPQLGTFSCVGALVQALLGYVSERRTKLPIEQAQQSMMESYAYAASTLRNAPVAESMGMGGAIQRIWQQKQMKFVTLQADASDFAGSSAAASKFVQITQGSMVMALGCLLTLTGHLPGGGVMMIVASILSGRALQPLVQLIAMWKMVATARDSYVRLEAFLEAQPPRRPTMVLPPPQGALALESVTAGPPGGGAPIVRGVSLALKPGESMAIVGPSAAGKTTLARLLCGIWPTYSGTVRLDGVDMYAWNKAELGPHVGYLPQGIELFEGSLADNIARFGSRDMELVVQAAKTVGVHDFIETLRDGYDTQVTVDGGVLSGGERQRIGLARAIYALPRFVVLDEPDSSLDEAGDRALIQALRTLKSAGVTVILITHRKPLIAEVDKLLVLVEGMTRHFGPRDDVLAQLGGGIKPAAPAPSPAQAKP